MAGIWIRRPIQTLARAMGWILAIALALLVFTEAVAFGANLRGKRKAEGLLREVRSLRVGPSTSADVEPIVRRYGAEPAIASSSDCPGAAQSYSIWTANRMLNLLSMRYPLLDRVGLRPAGASAMILLEAERVCLVYFGVGSRKTAAGEYLEASTTLTRAADDPHLEGLQYAVHISRVRDTRRIAVIVGPAASVEQFQHAFDYDFSCLTRFQGCQAVCEFMPSAWLDYQRYRRTHGWELSPEEAGDPYCKKLGALP